MKEKTEEQRQSQLQIRDSRVFAFIEQLEKAAKLPDNIQKSFVKMIEKKIQYMMDWEIAEMISSSDLVPKDYINKPQNVFLAVQTGRSLGLDEFQSVKHLYTVNGRTGLYGDMMLALAKDHKEYDDCLEEFGEMIDAGKDHGMLPKYARCTIKRVGKDDIVRDYTIEDAMRNPNFNQWGKNYSTGKYDVPGTWMRNGKRMMQMRARSFALRDAFPDKLSGVYDEYEIKEVTETKDITDQVIELGKQSGISGLKEELIKENKNLTEDIKNESEVEQDVEDNEPSNLQEMIDTMQSFLDGKKIKEKDFEKFCEMCNLGKWDEAISYHGKCLKKYGDETLGKFVSKLKKVVDDPIYRETITTLLNDGKIKRPDAKQNVLRTQNEAKAKEVYELIEQYKGFEEAEKKDKKWRGSGE